MNDSINRKGAINAVCTVLYPDADKMNDAKKVLKEMPSVQPEQRWIPCSERLPESIKPVIVTWKNTDPKSYYQYIVGRHFIGTAHYKNNKWFWYSSVTEDLLAEYGKCDAEEFDEAIEVIAWMPLPEPYQGEGETVATGGNTGRKRERMRKVTIKKNTDGDTRVAKAVPNFYSFKKSNEQHREDVREMMREIADDINVAGAHHDYTKVGNDTGSLFYRELCNTIEGQMNFEDGRWYKMHCEMERHHLNRHCPDDVNLIDVIEMICDCVCAGLARSGSVYPIEIPSEILQKAVSNTVDMCINAVDIEEGE